METRSAFLDFCKGNPLVASGFPSQRTNDAALWGFLYVALWRHSNGHDSGFSHILGVHLNMPTFPRSMLSANLHNMASLLFPSVFLHEEDQNRTRSFTDFWKYLLQETGYMHIQATKPDTIGKKRLFYCVPKKVSMWKFRSVLIVNQDIVVWLNY